MALSQNSKILVSDITSALAGKQDVLGFAPVKSVNGNTPDTNGNVTISATPTTVKGVLGSAWAANGTSMTLPSGGTWFVWNCYGHSYTGAYTSWEIKYYGINTNSNGSNSSFTQTGTTYAGGTTVYAKEKDSSGDEPVYRFGGKLAAIRIA